MTPPPLHTPTAPSRVSQMLGRFMPQRTPANYGGRLPSTAMPAVPREDEHFPDLAQRVRDVGEW